MFNNFLVGFCSVFTLVGLLSALFPRSTLSASKMGSEKTVKEERSSSIIMVLISIIVILLYTRFR